MRRLILVFNPRSSHFWKVQEEVLNKARKLQGFMLGKYEIKATNVDDNALRLAKVISDGDLVIAAGGDGTATIALNGVMLANKTGVEFGVLGYGNFNDCAYACGKLSFEEIIKGHSREAWPLECKVNGEHWRYALCYFTAGMFAESCAVFDEPKVRNKMQKKHVRKGLVGSMWTLAMWWRKNRKKNFFPEEFELFDSSTDAVKCKSCTDYLAVNNKRIAKVMRSSDYSQDEKKFLSYVGNMDRIWALFGFMFRSVFRTMPGGESDYDKISFEEAQSVTLQGEGEYMQFDGVKTIEVKKATKPILLICR